MPRTSTTLVMLAVLALPIGVPARADTTASAHSMRELFRIRLVNDRDGPISVSRDQGHSWRTLGRVLRYTTHVNRRAYTASKWVPAGRVAATAVNAIHVNAGYNLDDDRGIVFSILPRQFLSPPTDYDSFLSPDSSVYTDLSAGDTIFGGGYAPLVGSGVHRRGPDLATATDRPVRLTDHGHGRVSATHQRLQHRHSKIPGPEENNPHREHLLLQLRRHSTPTPSPQFELTMLPPGRPDFERRVRTGLRTGERHESG